MPRPPATLAWLLPLCCLSLACSGGANLQRPTASFRQPTVREVTPEGFTVDFNLDLQNPNAVDLPLAGTDYKVSLAGVKVVDDTAKPGGSVPANGSAPVTLPVTFSFDSLLKAERAIRGGGGNIPVEFDGVIDFAGGNSQLAGLGLGNSLRLPVHYEGTIPVRDLMRDPTILMRSPAAQRLFGTGLDRIFNR